MKICIFCHDSYMSGANLSLKDWITEDDNNNYMIIIPHKSHDFDGLGLNKTIIYGNYFCLCKELKKTSKIYRFKKIIKTVYMKLFYKTFIKKRLINIIKDYNPDVIISNSFSIWYGADIALTMNIPHIWYVREFMELDHEITHINIVKIKYLVENSYAIFISNSIKSYYSNKYHFKNNIRIYDKILYKDNLYQNIQRFTNHQTKAIFAGILQKGKGVMDAVKAAEELKKKNYDFLLDIYGDGPEKENIKKYIDTNNLTNVRLMGFTNKLDEIRSEYDICLVCSHMEALGRVTVESMYYGNLVIGANSGATKELVTSDRGYLYQCGNISDLTLVLEIAINKGESNNILIRNSHLWAVEYFSKPLSPKILDYIRNVVKDKNNNEMR